MAETYSADIEGISDSTDPDGNGAENQTVHQKSSSGDFPASTVEILDLSFSYPQYGRKKKLDVFLHAALTVESGHIHVVLGLPGTGKSTLAKILIRAVPGYTGGSFSGPIRIGNRDVTDSKLYDMMEIVGYAAQDPDEEIIVTTVEDEIAFPLESLGLSREEIGRRVNAALADFGLEAMRNAAPAELSGGEKKRLLLAVNEALQTNVIVMDETLEELDAQFRRRLLDYYRKQGFTVLITASKMDSLLTAEADAVSWLQDGQFRTGSKQEILSFYREHQHIEPVLYRNSRENSSQDSQDEVCSVEIRDLLFSYEKRFKLAVPELAIHSGEITAFVGPNGSGKSTLSKLLCGLLEPQQGAVSLSPQPGGESHGSAELQRYVGYLFQNPDYQIFTSTVDDELGYGLKRAGVTGKTYEDALERAKRLFSLRDEGDTPPSLLGYGERKRLQAAVYYLLPRKIYIFDEIDSGLSFREICSLLQIFADTGAGIVLVTHHLDFARLIAHRVITLENGQITAAEETGKVEKISETGQKDSAERWNR